MKTKNILTATLGLALAIAFAAVQALPASAATLPSVATAYGQTDTLPCGAGDIADDSVVYYDTARPSKSTIIGDSKSDSCGGLAVWDSTGHQIQYLQDGKMGNVDLRTQFKINGQSVALVGVNDRSDDTLRFYTVDPNTGLLTDKTGPNPRRTLAENYGFSLYKSPATGSYYAFVSTMSGKIQQFLLGDDGTYVTTKLVRTLDNVAITEGMAADDKLGYLYANREDVGTYKYGAEPTDSSTGVKVISVASGHVAPDLEGIDIVQGAKPGEGYVIVSSQARSEFAVYDLATDNRYVRTFTVDGVTHTDGLSLTTKAFPGAPKGLLVVHDDSNTPTSNLKLVHLEDVVDLAAIQ